MPRRTMRSAVNQIRQGLLTYPGAYRLLVFDRLSRLTIVRAFRAGPPRPVAISLSGRYMTKRTTSKYKLDRRMGESVWGRPKSPVNKRSYGPGQHGQRRARKLSDFGTQLQAKQKLKGYYANITERQFRSYYEKASRRPGDTGENMIGLLERRLDAVIYRAKFVPTVYSARQVVSHGHVRVNGQRVTVSSYLVKEGDTVELGPKAKEMALVLESVKSAERDVPDYVIADHGKMSAKFLRTPKLSDVPYPVQMQPHLIVEFYSR
jgi:small subunit ribosomal protein S4